VVIPKQAGVGTGEPPAGLRRRQALPQMRAAVRLSVLQFMRKKTKMSANLE